MDPSEPNGLIDVKYTKNDCEFDACCSFSHGRLTSHIADYEINDMIVDRADMTRWQRLNSVAYTIYTRQSGDSNEE